MNGFWNPLVDLLKHLGQERMINSRINGIIEVADTAGELSEKLFG